MVTLPCPLTGSPWRTCWGSTTTPWRSTSPTYWQLPGAYLGCGLERPPGHGSRDGGHEVGGQGGDGRRSVGALHGPGLSARILRRYRGAEHTIRGFSFPGWHLPHPYPGSLRSQGLLAPWEEAVEIGRRSGIPVHLTHYRQSAQGVGSHLDYLGLVENARDEGWTSPSTAIPNPYSGTTVTIGLPHWAKDGGPERLMAALQDADDRARMKREVTPEQAL